MKAVSKLIWAVVFILVFLITLKNTHEAVIYAFGQPIRSPMAMLALAFLIAGFVLGVLAMLPTFFRYRRDLSRSRVQLDALQKKHEAELSAHRQPPQPDQIAGA